ncbi:MAG: RIP metalloprotease RseP [Candidatus Vogelbacteria bacterium RIFOXYD1_FULL_44_32]|uniref:Zinc metalloprotease n=1 Tax=Candidatus Vogelbacteria bacterium RIFOXYD1_FULL_44_32 TaxID=1802438 RepID=A0A1G2QDT4_9BACT|nr:MAG: RIP metalloprotease RseP [Candidatus Vogelbacteria bacterium RIFOXYD1_FULL_44_32]
MTIVLFIFIIAVLVFVHELGHFLAAKLFGVRVDEFGLGFPPRAYARRLGETEYSLNFIPFGGFVKIFGETPDANTEAGPEHARSLTARPKWQQATILVAGVFFNWLLAWLFISIGFMSGLPLATSQATDVQLTDVRTAIIQVSAGSPAAKAGLKTGDVITYIASGRQNVNRPTVARFQEVIKKSPDLVTIGYERGDKKSQVSLVPEAGLIEEGKAIGVALGGIGTLRLPPLQAISKGFFQTWGMTKMIFSGLGDMVQGLWAGGSVKDTVMGPVGIAGLVGDARSLGWVYLLTFAAFISLDLAVINLMPFPALDGGRLFFLLIEAVKGSPIRPKIANIFNLVGFLLLIGLMLVVTFFDIWRLF